MHAHKGDVTVAFLQAGDRELERGVLAEPVQGLAETLKLQPWRVCGSGSRVRTGKRATSMVGKSQSGDGSFRLDPFLSGNLSLGAHE